jgi:type I restriction enzyme S subunit
MSAGWPTVALGEILVPAVREHRVDPSREYPLLGVRLDGQGPFHRETVLGTQTSATKLYKVKTGDFIYSRLFAWRGAFGLIEPDLDGHFVSNEFPTFTPISGRVEPKYLKYWFRLPDVLRRVEADCSGSTPLTRNRYKQQYLFALDLPLPPPDEQHRIVARIEQIVAKVEEARGLRSVAINEAEALSRSATDSIYKRLSSEIGLSRLGDACTSITDGDHLTPAFSEGGAKFIFVGNVSTGRLHFNGVKYVTPQYFKGLSASRVPQRDDLLYSAVGATLGVPAVVDVDDDFCFQRHVAILKPDRTKSLSRFLWHMLRSQSVFDKAWASSTGSAQPTIPLRAIRELPIPMPSLVRQKQLVEQLDALKAKVDTLKGLQTATAAELDAMLPAVLDKAFKGEL